MMIVSNYIYMFVKIDDAKRHEFYEEMKKTNFAFKILPSLDFFLRFLIQIIFASSAIQIFTTYIRRRTIEYEIAMSQVKKTRHRYIEAILKKIVQFDDWYYSFEYQIPFTFSIFSITFLLSSAVPLMLVLGTMFFSIKFYVEVKERLIYQNANLIPAYSIFSRKEQKD